MALVYRNKDGLQEIGGIKVVDSFKYLGVKIGGDRDIFKMHKQEIETGLEGKAGRLRRVVEKSYNRVEVGKMWWKNGIVPGLLHGIGVMEVGKGLIEKMQKVEYRVYRQLLGAAGYAPLAVIRGEIGTSLVKTRVMSARIMLVKGMIEGENKLVKDILGKVRELEGYGWNRTLDRYLEEVGMTFEDIGRMSKGEIKRRIKEYDTGCWWRELGGLRSVDVYREFKLGIGYDRPYDNGMESVLLFKARSNTLILGDRNRFRGGDGICELCRQEVEDIGHFILRCPGVRRARRAELLEKLGGEGDGERLGRMLFTGGRVGEVRRMLGDMWRLRYCRMVRVRRERGEEPLGVLSC